jgi:hypothetical protein
MRNKTNNFITIYKNRPSTTREFENTEGSLHPLITLSEDDFTIINLKNEIVKNMEYNKKSEDYFTK